MKMTRHQSTLPVVNDLGVHVFLDGEDWTGLRIVSPDGARSSRSRAGDPTGTSVSPSCSSRGAEPSLADVPLEELLGRFPAGEYTLIDRTVDGQRIEGTATLTHAIPGGPSNVAAALTPPATLVISWEAVTGPPAGFPNEPINIVGYQVIVDTFQVTVPAVQRSVTVSPEFVASLSSGAHTFEV